MNLSIIIPIYNGEKYLRDCLDTIFKTHLLDYEIIAVNDGSTDNSLEILKYYNQRYPFLKIINQTNSGVAVARNTGIKIAQGNYITFVDADDYVSSDILKCIVENELLPISNEVEFMISGHHRITHNNIIHTERLTKNILMGGAIKKYLGNSWVGIIESVWGKFYSTKILQDNDIEFQPGVSMYEDAIFNYNYMQYIHSLHVSNSVFYCYRKNLGSATTQFKGEKAISDIAANLNAALLFYKNEFNKWDDTIYHKLHQHYAYCMISQIYTIYRNNNIKNRLDWLRKYVTFANSQSTNWLLYLKGGFSGFVGHLLYKKQYKITSIVLTLIFNIEKIRYYTFPK